MTNVGLFFGQGNRLTSLFIFVFFATLLSTKSIYSYSLGVLVFFCLWRIRFFRSVSLDRPEKIIFFWVFLFSFFCILTTLWHGSYSRSFEVPIKFALSIPLFVYFFKFPPKPIAFWCGLSVSVISGFGVAVWKMFQSGEFKAFGYTGAIQFGNISLTIAIFLLAGFFWLCINRSRFRISWLILCALGAIFGLLGSYYSGTRGGWVAIPVFFVIFMLFFIRQNRSYSGYILVLASIAIAGGFVSNSSIITHRIENVRQDITEYQINGASSSSSLGARFAIWEASLNILSKQPVLGLGEIQFREKLKEAVEAGELGVVPANLANTHNTFLEIWVLYGGISLFALIGFLISNIYYFYVYMRSPDSVISCYGLLGFCLTIGYIIYGQTQIMLIRNNTLVFFLLTLGVILSLIKQRKKYINN
ncbi:O-antigen ligase family protein [Alcaligenes faecalis]|uniref:O-antigen ligase family protein n=1 Tax=Alcaligenes aquatilis TaxID=323284 RepID=UPI002AA7AE79|nr:O-antigen ligase family protein [Alcaligenes faecalis]